MTSQERHDARYQRRKAARQAKHRARIAQYDNFDRVADVSSLVDANYNARKGVMWKASVARYNARYFKNSIKIHKTLMRGGDTRRGFYHFGIVERGKKRAIHSLHYSERVVRRSACTNALVPILSSNLIYDNGASRIGKGLHWQIKRIKQQLARHYRKYGRAGGVLLLDLKKFFPYAPHSIIYQRHQRYILNPDFRRIADTIIDTAPGEFPGRGMPLGVEPSQQEMAAMPSAVDNWIKCQMSTHSAGHYMDDYCIILPDIEDLKKLGRAIVRQFEIRGIPVNKKKCKIIPLTKPFRWCKARFTLTETGKIKVNGSRDGVIRARRKLKLFHREWLAGKRTLQEVAQYMNCQEAYYKNFDDHGRLLRLRRLCYAIFGGRVPCSTKSSKPVMAPSLP